jgi:hypothetical protein
MVARTVSKRGGVYFVELPVTVEATPDYSSGDLVGGLLNISDIESEKKFGGGLIQSVLITDLAKQDIDKDVVFFDTNPSNTTFTENAALDIADADLVNILGVAQVTTWIDFNDNSIGQALNLAIPFSNTALYAAIMERGTANYASTSDLTIRVGILPA